MRVLVVSVGVVARAWLMAKEFRPVRRDQVFLMPPDMREWLPSDHLVWFILDTLEALDLTGLEATRRRGGVGAAGYDPRMLLGLLMYGYCRGVRSSRQIERLCGTDVAFRVLCAQDVPDHCTLARFRADCQDGFTSLFTQVLMIAGRAGLARFGTVAIDGTKIAANASIDANRGQEWLALEVNQMVTDAEQVDAQEDVLSAQGHLPAEGERLPATLTDGKGRQARIRAAAAEVTKILEQQAQADQVRDAAARQRRERAEAGESVIGRIPAGPHRLAEALAHLDREVARQQAKRASCRENRGGEEADGRTTGTCRGTLERHQGPPRRGSRMGRRGRQPQPGLEPAITGQEAAEDRREHYRPLLPPDADPTRFPAGLQRPGGRDQ